MIAFQDFPAQMTSSGFFSNTYESLQDALSRANRWISQQGVRVLNVETVVLPEMWSSGEEGTTDVDLTTSGKMMSSWHQFIRVWYETTG